MIMKCLNCSQEIPDKAKLCPHCEAPIMDEPSAEEMQAARDIIDNLPMDVAAELQQVFFESDTAEDFVNRIMVGNCPGCNSAKTGDCENDPDIGELLVGRCYDCGQLWCTECGKLLTPQAPVCECWDEDPFSEDEAGIKE
jgi:hypothetical protein